MGPEMVPTRHKERRYIATAKKVTFSPSESIAWHPAGTMLCTVGGAGVYMLTYLP
jgi:hypothetical protein